ncbi:MAG: hypothetical protein KGL39_44860 [Patescibacteria group bacterium]|nr:hypothetical protein [Patescibacteria group bacterium]
MTIIRRWSAEKGAYEYVTPEPTAREILAAALCDAVNGSSVHETLTNDQRTNWLHRADRVIHELAERDWICVGMEELEQKL